jgi:hypothetical protein
MSHYLMILMENSEPMGTIKVGGSKRSIGITSIRVIGTTSLSGQRLLISYNDGSVAIFDFVTKRLVYLTQSAHSETIFDVKLVYHIHIAHADMTYISERCNALPHWRQSLTCV